MAPMTQEPSVVPRAELVVGSQESGDGSTPRNASSSEPVPDRLASRSDRIRLAAERGDLKRLRDMANEPGGYESDELRRIVWPLLLRCDIKGKGREQAATLDLDRLAMRDDERQVQLDIARSLINYPRGVTEAERDSLRIRLEKAILLVLRRHPALQYFQGYHDIVSILLLVLDDDELLASAAEQMSLHRIRDSMGPGLEPTLGYLKLAHRLIQIIDPEMYSLVNQAASMPFFALSWALTLFSHDLYEVAVIARLFDFLLAHNPAMISYLVVAILLTKKADLVGCLAEGDDDPATVHSVLSQLPNLVLCDPLSSRPQPLPPSSSDSTKPTSPDGASYSSEPESETLFSSPSSASYASLALDLDSTASSSTLDVSDSLISLSETSPSCSSSSALDNPSPSNLTTLRHRHHTPPTNRSRDRRSFSSFDSEIHALDDSMLSDPDIDNPAFAAFPASITTTTTSTHESVEEGCSTTSSSPPPRIASPPGPPRPRSPPRDGRLRARGGDADGGGNDELGRGAARTVLVDDLVRTALDLWDTYPLVPTAAAATAESGSSSPYPSSSSYDGAAATAAAAAAVAISLSSSSSSSSSRSIRADTVLGPNSCVFTYDRSIDGRLDDDEAELVCRTGTDIVYLEALLPDRPPSPTSSLDEYDDDDDDDDEEEEDDEDQDQDEEEEEGQGEGEEGGGRDGDQIEDEGFEIVGPTRTTTTTTAAKNDKVKGRRRRRHKKAAGARGGGSRSSRRPVGSTYATGGGGAGGGGGGGRINLGPHGWLVVGGVAVATAVAYGVYGAGGGRGGGGGPPGGGGGSTGPGYGLGTGGLGLRTGLGGLGVGPGPRPPRVPAAPGGGGGGGANAAIEGVGGLVKEWARGVAEL